MSKISEQTQLVEAEIRKLEDMGGSLSGKAKKLRDSAFTRFPVVFMLLSTCGLVATLYGFEKVIDEVGFFASHPEMILVVGLVTLAFTGTLYRKLN